MKLPRALVFSVVLTLAATLILSHFFGPHALALFLFLPLGIFLGKRTAKDGDKSPNPASTDREPIEPR